MRYRFRLAVLVMAFAPAALLAHDQLPMPECMTVAWVGGDNVRWTEEYWTPPRADFDPGRQ